MAAHGDLPECQQVRTGDGRHSEVPLARQGAGLLDGGSQRADAVPRRRLTNAVAATASCVSTRLFTVSEVGRITVAVAVAVGVGASWWVVLVAVGVGVSVSVGFAESGSRPGHPDDPTTPLTRH